MTPGISALEYAERRARLAQSLPPGSIAVLAASDIKYRSGAVFYRFHQDPNFLYLTGVWQRSDLWTKCLQGPGFNEPEAIAIIGITMPSPAPPSQWRLTMIREA